MTSPISTDGIRDSMVQVADDLLRQTGFCPRPMVHMFAEDLAQPYIGYVTCRDFMRGADAVDAIAGLGLLPSVLAATGLVVVWEDCDLRTALEMPGNSFATAIVTVEASFTEHTLTWHPFDVQIGPLSEAGLPTVQPQWKPILRYTNPVLLSPVTGLLDLWRQVRRDDIRQTALGLQQVGYTINWANPSA
jgi:hypothetical protein